MRVVVTGANRGIGLELVRQLLARGDHVEACVRDPERATALRELAGEALRVHRVDVTEPASIAELARTLGDAPVDLVINDAGVYGGSHQSLGQLARDSSPSAWADLASTYAVNAIGALRVTVALLPHVRRGTGKKLVHITSGMGSIADNTSGGYYAYRMSKAALNMMSKSLAVDLRGEGILSVVINPGWVQTDMGGVNAPTPVGDSVRGILTQIDAAALEHSGEFLNWKGGRYAW
jgi:NAD(P)-dependent dehydrogenase (short-subunit alcohol dehydrogenase family)